MPNAQNTAVVVKIKEKLTAHSGLILADYRGLSVKDMQELRGKVRDAGGEVKIFKNTLMEIAIRELAMPAMDDYLVGPTAIVFISEDPVAPAKALTEFAKAHKALEIKGGLIDNAVVDQSAVNAIAALPSREELVAKFMGQLLNPVRGFMTMANAPVGAFARALQAVADQKEAA